MPLQLKLAGVTIAPSEIDAKVELYDIVLSRTTSEACCRAAYFLFAVILCSGCFLYLGALR